MSHRTYLYNINTPAKAEHTDKMMMEWGYEMPLMLQPLLIEGGFISGNNYNNHVEFNDSGLYYDAHPGIENLKRFYNFLENQSGLINDIEKFKEVKEKLFNYLDRLTGSYFHLDIWDVLNMDDTPHEEQAKDWLANIAHNNLVITRAMDAGDIGLLNYKELRDVSPAFISFPDLVNYPDYDYGWSCIWTSVEEEFPYEIFEENKFWGLKDKEGQVLLSPQFDEFYSFGPLDRAVVSKNGKYGYVDTAGRIVVPFTWDDAFDFEYSGVAVVALQGKTGLINLKGDQVTQIIYEELQAIADGNCFTAKKDTFWGAIDASGKVVIDFEHNNEIQAGYGFYHIAVNGQKNQKIYNEVFKYLGEFPVQAIENLDSGLLLIRPHKGSTFGSIYKNDGTLLENGFEKINRQTNFPDLIVIRKGKKHGALSRQKAGYVLPCEFDAILDIGVILKGSSTDVALVHQAEKKGVYNGNPAKPSWLIPLDDYQQIIWLHEMVFALQKNQMWSIANAAKNTFSDFEFDMVVQKPNEGGFAYAFKADEVYSVSEAGIKPTSKTIALEHASDDYAYYFEYESRKRLLAYGKGQKMNDQQLQDELSNAHTLFELAEEAYEIEDYEKAIHYYTIASEKGYSPSVNNLAHIYYNIEGFQDDDKAFFWYHKGALTGDENAMNGLGMCYKYGVGCPVDVEKALHWLNKAAEAQLALAHNNLGNLYSEEGLLPFNADKALGHYQAAADLGEPNYTWLGYLHDLKGDYEKAFGFYQLDVEQGSDVSAYNLGVFYRNGLGTNKNIDLAIECFKLSADREYHLAHLELAKIYRDEKGFRDEKKAEEHIKEARAAGLEIPEEPWCAPRP